MDRTLFDKFKDSAIKRAADREDQGKSVNSTRKFKELEKMMKDRGISHEDAKEFMKEAYAPVSDNLNFSLLTPTMCDNLMEDIEEGRLEG